MEVVVSAAVLVLVVLGVFAGLDAVAGTAGANKARTVAATLAERDQEELRSLMTVDLNRIRSVIPGPRTVHVDGVPYTVESDADLVTDVGGEDISCSLDDGEGSYIRITSKVTSPMTGAKVKPVVISSIVAPEPGSGALVAKVVDARDNPVKNMPVQAIGPETITKATNDAGCAVFGAVTAGAYQVKVNQNGWVDPEGDQEVIKTATVSAGTLTTVDFVYDLAATLTVNIRSPYGSPAVLNVDNSYGVIAAHTGILTGFRQWTSATPITPHTLNRLFPFEDPYKIFSGRCMDQDPTGFQENYFDVYTAAAPTLTPGQVGTITILEPAVNINATFNQTANASNVYAYPRGGTCGDPVRYDMGAVTSTRATNPGLPFGTYDICVQYRRSSNNTWYALTRTNVANTSINGTASQRFDIRAGDDPVDPSGDLRVNRLRQEAGMTLMELITAITIGMIVMLAMFTVLDNTVRMNTNAMAKTDAMQRGRLAMDVMTQELRSQVCLENLAGPAIVPDVTNSTTVEFYSDFSEGDGTVPPTKRRLKYDPATGDVTTAIWLTNRLEPRPGDFPIAPANTQLRLENIALQKDAGGNTIPFLRYYAYRWVGNPARPEASLELVPPIDANEARRVARIDVTLMSQPLGADDRTKGVNLTDRVMARHSDPNLAKWDVANPTLPDPRCV